jgi:UrcA family protein
MNRSLAAFLALLFASLTVSSACFAEPRDQASLLVSYDEVDLLTPAGVKALHRRIDLAARQVCLDVSGPSPGGQADLGCEADALASGSSQIQDAITRQRLGKSPAMGVIENSPTPNHP